jgi:hypothetical protein
MDRQLESGEGELFLPDSNRSLMGGKIKFLEALGINTLLQQDTEWTNDSQILIDLSIKSRQFAESIKSVLGVTIKEEDSPVAIAQKFLRQSLGLAFSSPIKRGAKGNQQRYYQPVEIPELRQKTLEVWRQRDEAAKASQQTAEAALKSLSTPDANENMGVESVVLSLNSDIEVGSTGNIYRSPVLPTESAAYQTAAYQDEGVGSELEQLVEALPFVETVDDFAAVVEGSPRQAIEDAIALSGDQPRRQQLTAWYEAIQQLASGEISQQQWEVIAAHSPPAWHGKVKAYGELLVEAISFGLETVRVLLQPWSQHERSAAIFKAEELYPEAMEKLRQIEPNWSDLCVAW